MSRGTDYVRQDRPKPDGVGGAAICFQIAAVVHRGQLEWPILRHTEPNQGARLIVHCSIFLDFFVQRT
jgi:hypothetical protein